MTVLASTACTVIMPPSPGDVRYAPVEVEKLQPPAPNPGGIYQPEHGLSLFADRRASRVGDIITIVLTEQTRSSKSADTEVKKDSSTDFNEPSILGAPVSAGAHSLLTNIAQNRSFKGGAKSDQSNSLNGSITVTVAQVLPNGLLKVRGEKWLTLNRGDEFIRVSGLIRPEDITADNSIPSTKLADARISYAGRGELADSNKIGWIARFFNHPIWPF